MQLVFRSTRAVVLLLLILVSRAGARAELPTFIGPLVNGFRQDARTGADFTSPFPIQFAARHSWIDIGNLRGPSPQPEESAPGDAIPLSSNDQVLATPQPWRELAKPEIALNMDGPAVGTSLATEPAVKRSHTPALDGNLKSNAKRASVAVSSAKPSASKQALAAAHFRSLWLNRNVAIWCIVGALIVVTALLAWLILMLWRSGLGSPQTLAPVLASGTTRRALLSARETEDLLAARARALAEEALANPQTRTLREQMAAELAEFAKQSLVQGIYSQRQQLIEIQQRAQQELAELEARLNALHLPLQERLRAYETRIAELEQELETRDEEMRNMIRTTLLLVRQRMELEKAAEPNVNQYN